MKNFVIGLMLVVFVTSTGCSKKCDNAAPSARILNNGTTVASVQIKTSNGSTTNINNVDPQTASPSASYAAGDITFTITVNKVPYVKVLTASNCFDYDIAIDAANVITITAKDRNS
jgi:hypothetical protein